MCLPFIGLMPVVAAREFGINPRSAGYGVLYACFGVGALVGAISIGTFLARVRKDWIVRFGLAGFAVMLAGFAVVRSPVLAYPVVALVGTFYFAMITALSTAMQERLADAVRGRFMALWIMGFGGVISVGNLIGGPIAQVAGPRYLLLAVAVAALGLAWYADVRPPPPLVSPEVDSGLSAARR